MNNIIFEIVPPSVNWDEKKINSWVDSVCNLLKHNKLSLINIPEVIDEGTKVRKGAFIPKMDPLLFAGRLRKKIPDLEIIPNKVCVHLPYKEFEAWMSHIYEIGTRQIVLVGGSEDKVYPGYTVTEAVRWVKKNYPDMKVGGITIFTRPDEVERLVKKTEAGIDFFISQIIFETSYMKHVLQGFSHAIGTLDTPLPKFFISLTVPSKTKDLQFLKWLGVEIPSAIYDYLINNPGKIESMAYELVTNLLVDIIQFQEKFKLTLGFNVEHIMYGNLLLAEKLFKLVQEKEMLLIHTQWDSLSINKKG